jgi:hypothetical protein
MIAEQPPRLVGIGGIFIDDIVLPTGQTYMHQLGGGVVHAMMGVATWDERPGICAPVGTGLPTEARLALETSLDTIGLYLLGIPQIRAWQLFEEDGSRREVYRVKEIAPFIQGPQIAHLPASYTQSQAYYLLQDCAGITRWREHLRGMIFWEPLQQIMIPENRDLFRQTLKTCAVDIVSPNGLEACAIYGEKSPQELVNCLLDDGATCAIVRLGAEGSVVGDQSGKCWHIPTFDVDVIDQTGAGNTYCGAFLWAIMCGYAVWQAGAIGATTASFCLQGVGVLDPTQVNRTERDRRYQDIVGRVREV